MSYNSSANIVAHKFKFKSIDGNEIKLIDFKGKPIFIINTASLCGFTNQYKDIEEIYNQYKRDELIVLEYLQTILETRNCLPMKVKEFCSITLDGILLTEITKLR